MTLYKYNGFFGKRHVFLYYLMCIIYIYLRVAFNQHRPYFFLSQNERIDTNTFEGIYLQTYLGTTARFIIPIIILCNVHCRWVSLLCITPLKKYYHLPFFKLTRPSKARKECFLRQILLSDLRLDTYEWK